MQGKLHKTLVHGYIISAILINRHRSVQHAIPEFSLEIIVLLGRVGTHHTRAKLSYSMHASDTPEVRVRLHAQACRLDKWETVLEACCNI
jgi:hypothetical protein